jgi:hypothetical protein
MITIDTWRGLVTAGSPYALPPGSAVTQSNWQCRRPGELMARGGQAIVTFATHAATTSQVVEMFRCPLGASEGVIYQSADGNIRVARGLT